MRSINNNREILFAFIVVWRCYSLRICRPNSCFMAAFERVNERLQTNKKRNNCRCGRPWSIAQFTDIVGFHPLRATGYGYRMKMTSANATAIRTQTHRTCGKRIYFENAFHALSDDSLLHKSNESDHTNPLHIGIAPYRTIVSVQTNAAKRFQFTFCLHPVVGVCAWFSAVAAAIRRGLSGSSV